MPLNYKKSFFTFLGYLFSLLLSVEMWADPLVTAASYDEYTDTLTLTFNEDMDSNASGNLGLSVDNGNAEFINSSAQNITFLGDNRSFDLGLSPSDASTVEGWATVETALEVELQAGAFQSASPNYLPSQEQLYADDVVVAYIASEPQVVNASYDAFEDTLFLTFNRDMDPAATGQFDLSVDNGSVEFLNSTASSVSLEGGRTFALTLNPGDATAVESWASVTTALEVELQAAD